MAMEQLFPMQRRPYGDLWDVCSLTEIDISAANDRGRTTSSQVEIRFCCQQAIQRAVL
jgi:hypothetical protein